MVKSGKSAGFPVKAKAVKPSRSNRNFEELMEEGAKFAQELNLDGAILMYEEALSLKENDVKVLDALGQCYFDSGNFELAEKVLKKSISINPDGYYNSHLYLGQLLSGKKAAETFKKGIDLLEKYIQGENNTGENRRLIRQLSSAYCSLAELYMTDLCDEQDAEKTCEMFSTRAVEIDPDNSEAQQTLGNFRMCQSKPKDAVPHILKAIDLIVKMHEREEEEEEEEEEGDEDMSRNDSGKHADITLDDPFEMVSELPSYDSRFALSKIAMELELYPQAISVLERLLAEDDSNMEAFYLIAEAYYLQGEYAEAYEYLQIAIEMIDNVLDEGKSSKQGGPLNEGLLKLPPTQLKEMKEMLEKLFTLIAQKHSASISENAMEEE
jgi:tetratricopeptide (TPR) repeat protein